MLAAKCKIADFVVSDAILKSCAHAYNRYNMYLMDKKAEQERTEKGRKRKALMEDLTSAKKAKEDLVKVSKKWLIQQIGTSRSTPWLWHL